MANERELRDEEMEKVIGGVDDGYADNAGEILDEYAKKDKRVKTVPFCSDNL